MHLATCNARTTLLSRHGSFLMSFCRNRGREGVRPAAGKHRPLRVMILLPLCEYVTDLPTLPGLGSSTYVLAKSSSAGKLLGLAAKVFSPKEINRDVSLSSESDTIAYEVTCSSKRELGKAGVKRSIYDMRLLASFSPAITLYAAASKNSYEFLLAFFSSSMRLAKS